MNIKKLIKKSRQLRIETFYAFFKKGEAHLGGAFSMIEILITIYDIILKKPDKFILSKAHASYPLCLLLRKKGFKTRLTTHLEIDKPNGIHCTTGSLGHGLPMAVGMAFAKKKQNFKGKIYVLISDGECQEGTTWESLLIATKHKLNNLIVIVDYNKIQALSKLEDALPLDNLYKKFKAFNCNCVNVADGHSFKQLIKSLKLRRNIKMPTVIIANTVKGNGIKEFENDPVWHARKIEYKDFKLGLKRL